MMNVDLSKKDLISLVKGTCPNMDKTLELQKQGLMEFTGNQWNEDWDWNRTALNKLNEKQLLELYKDIKGGK
jgi:hypothetical protein